MALALRRNGASAGSVVAFLLGNPTLNPAVMAWIVIALGWQWGLLRAGLGILLVVAAAALAARLAPGPAVDLAGAAEPSLPGPSRHPVVRWLVSFTRLVVTLAPMFVVLVLALGAARAVLFPVPGEDWGNSWPLVVGLAVAGMLFPIPTGAEIPIVQALVASGLGPAPAAALLLTLAPVSLPSLAMMAHGLPLRVVVALAALTVGAGLAGAGIAAAALS